MSQSAQSSPTTGTTQDTDSSNKYGELIVLGTNGSLPKPLDGNASLKLDQRWRNKFVLSQRPEANGIKRSTDRGVEVNPSRAVSEDSSHYMSFCFTERLTNITTTNIIEYTHDENTDMFQVGRSTVSAIDFIVLDRKASTSRFACRIQIDRHEPHTARIYAAGFDSTKNMFLGENAISWGKGNDMDGLTTNGVWIKHPDGDWCEVSLRGETFEVRCPRSARTRGRVVKGVGNILQDWTLIDLSGATLLWRSKEGLANSPTKGYVQGLVNQVNVERLMCPVDLTELHLDCLRTQYNNHRQPYVYLNCGHLQSQHGWGCSESRVEHYTCPLCRINGPVKKLRMGLEVAFYVDGPAKLYAFNPCGHAANFNTVNYWASKEVPMEATEDTTDAAYLIAVCPFCFTPLCKTRKFVRLFLTTL